VFSSLGFYAVTPATDQYVIGSPLFKKAVLSLENGNKFTISAENNSDTNFYIQSASLNGKNYENTFLNFGDIQKGGEFIIDLSDKPDQYWGNKADNAPYSLSRIN